MPTATLAIIKLRNYSAGKWAEAANDLGKFVDALTGKRKRAKKIARNLRGQKGLVMNKFSDDFITNDDTFQSADEVLSCSDDEGYTPTAEDFADLHADDTEPEKAANVADTGAQAAETANSTEPAKNFDAEYLRLIKLDIAEAQANRHKMPAVAKRGLNDETIDHFHFGYLSAWILTKSRAQWNCGIYVDKDGNPKKSLPPPSERIIIPTASMNHFNAVATQLARYKLEKDFWKQHAGDMELFCDADALKADVILVVEGEIDAASIWQAFQGKIAVVAILGCSNWKKTLLPKLPELRGKKFVLLLDADAAGKKNAKRLLDELLDRGYPAVAKTLYDCLYPDEQKNFGKKIDANTFLTTPNLGEGYLKLLIQKKILERLDEDFQKAEAEIKQREIAAKEKASQPTNAELSTPISGANTDFDSNEIKRILKEFVHAKDLVRDDWWGVGAILFRYGFTLDDFNAWSNDGDKRYDPARCEIEWNSYAERAKDLKDDEGYHVATLIKLAKEKGYKPPPKTPTLPIKIKLPEGVTFKGNKILLDVTVRKEVKQVAAARTLIVPTKRFVNNGGGNLRYEIAIRSPLGEWTRAVVGMRTLLEPSKIYELTEHGAIVAEAKLLTRYFSKLLAEPENEKIIPTVTIYTRPGWHGDNFIYPTPAEGENYRVERSGIDYDSIFKARGDKDAWLNKFLEVTNTSTVKQRALKRACIGAALVAPMLEILEIPNPQLNLWGTSNFAKTPLLKLGLSIFGNPGEGEMLRTWNATPKNMLTMAAGFNGLPLLIDEGETMSKWTQASLSEYVYNFATGIIGQANKRNGDVRATEKFRGVRFSTAEHPFHDTNDKQGNFKRMIDIHVTEPFFTDDYARELHIFCGRNYGHFGRAWTKFLADNRDKVSSGFDELFSAFSKYGFDRDGKAVRLNTVDATNARAVIAFVYAFHGFSAEITKTQASLSEMLVDAAQILAQLPTITEINDLQRAKDLLIAWTVEHSDRFIKYHLNDNGNYVECHASSSIVAVGKKRRDGSIAFFANAFRQIVAEIGLPNYEKFLCDLYEADLLDCKDSRTKARVITALGNKVKAYILKAELFEKGDYETVDYTE